MRRIVLAATILLSLAACTKKSPVAAAIPKTPAPPPTNTSTAEPARQTTATRTPPATISSPRTNDDAAVRKAIEGLNAVLADAFFDFDKYNLRPDAVKSLTENAAVLQQAMNRDRGLVLTVEGHCDERGSAEYNVALGDKRASEAKHLLVQLGLTDSQIKTVSYGAERPVCTESNENCWQKNRRAHVTYARAN